MFSRNVKQAAVFDFQHVNSQCRVLPEITPHIFADSDYLKPGATMLPIKGKKRLFWRHQCSCILSSLAGIGLLIHLCSLRRAMM